MSVFFYWENLTSKCGIGLLTKVVSILILKLNTNICIYIELNSRKVLNDKGKDKCRRIQDESKSYFNFN